MTLLLTRRWRKDVLGGRLLLHNTEVWSYWLQSSSSLFWCCTPQQSPGVKRHQSPQRHRCGRSVKQHRLLSTAEEPFIKSRQHTSAEVLYSLVSFPTWTLCGHGRHTGPVTCVWVIPLHRVQNIQSIVPTYGKITLKWQMQNWSACIYNYNDQ